MTAPPEFPGIRTLTASEMFALDLNATALAEESSSPEERGYQPGRQPGTVAEPRGQR
jgi:hypothetical protein